MATSGFKDLARMTVYVPQPYQRNCSNCQIAKNVITLLHRRLAARKPVCDSKQSTGGVPLVFGAHGRWLEN